MTLILGTKECFVLIGCTNEFDRYNPKTIMAVYPPGGISTASQFGTKVLSWEFGNLYYDSYDISSK